MVKKLFEKQDRKVSMKLPHIFIMKRVLDGSERVVTA